MPTFRKIIKAGELPMQFAKRFADPDQLVSVTISDADLNLAAPSEAERELLAGMSATEQKQLYEKAILSASKQEAVNVRKDEIKAAALNLPRYA